MKRGVLGLLLVAMPALAEEMRTIESTPEKVRAGAAIYTICGACHGLNGEGRVGLAPMITSKTFLEAASDRMLVQTIREGRAGTTMVGWGPSFKPEQIEALVAFVRAALPTDPAQLDEGELLGDVERGGETFATICAPCHGRSGGGYQDGGSGTGIGRQAFLDSVTNGFLRYVIRQGKSQTNMRSFDRRSATALVNLTDQEIEDVIAYLRKNA